ncbi:NAD(P)-binding protein [Periconia macrospinosa]|uniref:NAD(P)-binding protein n=1 Tax=Periconia macrospinosa TaxID=97972 RepID=A0A2V1DA06_9PLEO|nr:NAD(P)-binding protein [Periconia macrospinosa]
MEDFLACIEETIRTDFVSTTHKTAYPAISPTRPELSQANRVVLITGGGTGIGKMTALQFARASASHVIIAGRREDVLHAAVEELTQSAKEAGSPTQFLSYKLDMTKKSDIVALFEDLASKKLEVDVLVLNAAKFAGMTPLLELGADEVWTFMEANVKSAMHFTEAFAKQNVSKQKFLVNLTSGVVHHQNNPTVINLAPYFLSKASAGIFIQAISNQVPREQLQVITVHPGTIHNDAFEGLGITKETLPFDEVDLPASFIVWVASKEAAFLHGKTVWAAWDVEELAKGELRKRIDEDKDFLQLSVVGLKGSNRAPGY